MRKHNLVCDLVYFSIFKLIILSWTQNRKVSDLGCNYATYNENEKNKLSNAIDYIQINTTTRRMGFMNLVFSDTLGAGASDATRLP